MPHAHSSNNGPNPISRCQFHAPVGPPAARPSRNLVSRDPAVTDLFDDEAAGRDGSRSRVPFVGHLDGFGRLLQDRLAVIEQGQLVKLLNVCGEKTGMSKAGRHTSIRRERQQHALGCLDMVKVKWHVCQNSWQCILVILLKST